MAATNDFQSIAGGSGANVLTQAEYLALTTILANGMTSGIVPSNQMNKMLRQCSIIAAMVAQLIADATGQNATDDGTTATLEANLARAIRGDVWQGVDTGAVNAYAVALKPASLGLAPGMLVAIDAIVATNTAASTLDVDGHGALPVVFPGGGALAGGELVAGDGAIFRLNHAGTEWILISSTGAAVGATPAQFDNSNNIVTTSFLKRAGIQLSGQITLANSTSLTIGQAGNQVTVSGNTGPITLTLPLSNAAPAYSAVFVIWNRSSYNVTVAPASGDTIGVSNAVLGPWQSMAVSNDGNTQWNKLWNDADIVSSFPASMASNGYQKLPSGLILQWGSATITTANTLQSVTLPIAFPNNHFTSIGGSDSVNSFGGATPNSLSAVDVFANNATAQVSFLSIGN